MDYPFKQAAYVSFSLTRCGSTELFIYGFSLQVKQHFYIDHTHNLSFNLQS